MATERIENISDADLDWLAFQYAANELPGAEVDAFDRLLATDERACAALARAVTLSQAVVAAESVPARISGVVHRAVAVRASDSRRFSRGLLAATTVACGLLFVGWLSVRAPREESVVPDSAATVASLWVAGADEDAADEVAVPDAATNELVEEDPVPGWLMAALSEQQQAMEDEEIISD